MTIQIYRNVLGFLEYIDNERLTIGKITVYPENIFVISSSLPIERVINKTDYEISLIKKEGLLMFFSYTLKPVIIKGTPGRPGSNGTDGGIIIETSQDAIVAAGNDQATATPLDWNLNRVDFVDPGTGVKYNFAVLAVSPKQTMQNNGLNDVLYYPHLGMAFYTVGSGVHNINDPVTVAPGGQVTVFPYSPSILTFI